MKYLAPQEGRTKRGNLKYLEQLRGLARNKRRNRTLAEIILWGKIKNTKLGFKFLQQKPIGRFILDLYCPKLLLAIEIDGGYHQQRENYDLGRDELLTTRGIKTIRYKNDQIVSNLNNVVKDIIKIINERKSELEL